jgi:hypothetical protein
MERTAQLLDLPVASRREVALLFVTAPALAVAWVLESVRLR